MPLDHFFRCIPASTIAAVSLIIATPSSAQDKAQPAIAGFGAIHPFGDGTNPPDPSRRYRVVFEVTRTASDPAKVNPAFDRVARFVNLLGAAGIRPADGDIVLVVHGPATPGVLANSAYRARFGVANPNSDLIAALREAGVSLHVCSYALANAKIDREAVTPAWSIDVAAMITIINLMTDGWALLEG